MTIYDLKLHETMPSDEENRILIMRVPGGWKYDNVFVPYSTEFKPKVPGRAEDGL